MSSASSSPIDSRINLSPIPDAGGTSCGTRQCAVDAEWHTSDSLPPRLTASLSCRVTDIVRRMQHCGYS